ncbi:hypothetical protein [Nocardioides rubriscoriae]|uniref:hypothetical protein n=1 Tax=Nocardioides rubriscoriae TaxID=642762 RepID=UPI0011DFAAFD|nr:hypothetical protein [Nocardioides rubriscoriae]
MPTRCPALAVLVLVLALAGCGREDDDAPTVAPAVTSTTPTSSAPASPSVDAVRVVVPDLPTGPPPRVDVVVDDRLFHDGRKIALPDDLAGAYPLGGYRGRTYLSMGGRIVTVADDGSVTSVGEPHDTYNRLPALVTGTGHVLFPVQDRSGPTVVTVMDAVTGEDLAVVRGPYRRRASGYDALEPADRALAESWEDDGAMDDVDVAARSADGTVEVVTSVPDDAGTPVVLTLQSARDGDGAVAFAFPFPDPEAVTYDVVLTDQVVLEGDDSFLVVTATGENAEGFDHVVVRCTTRGACERTTPVGTQVQVAGTDLPLSAAAR